MRLSIKISLVFIFLSGFVFGQREVKIFSKSFVKKGRLIFRIVPADKNSFEAINSSTLQIMRREMKNEVFVNETLLVKRLKCYNANDFKSWERLIKKDKNKGAFVYKALYNNKPDPKLEISKAKQRSKIIYDMLLLSCDFDSDIAQACGLYFQDSTINNETRYEYKIYYTDNKGEKKVIEIINVNATVLSGNMVINDLVGKQKRSIMNLKWNPSKYKEEYGGYNIERSEDSVSYKRVNSSPAILFTSQSEKNKEYLFYSDTMPALHQKYFYRIKGINFFGEESDPSNVITVYNAGTLSSMPVLDCVNVIGNNKTFIKWNMSVKEDAKQVKEYILVESEKDSGPYKMIYTGPNTEYTDTILSTTNYYKAGAITFDGDTVFSYSRYAVIIDTLPPDIPIGLEGHVTQNGLVIIKWKGNKDCIGYKLFRANSIKDEFAQINNKFIKDTVYTEKLNLKTLSENIYYRVSATDQNFNTSANSLILRVKRPDTIPPSAPIIKQGVCHSNEVEIRFILSHSDDVACHSIMKKRDIDSAYQAISVIPGDSTEWFTDTSVVSGEIYFYKIVAVDSSGNKSASDPITVKNETGYTRKITDLKYSVDRKLKSIHLNWQYGGFNIEKFILYRGKENEEISILKTIEGNTFNYKDLNAQIGNTYLYRIKAVMYSGAESIISDVFKIIY